jgi:hypothetical protein
MDLVFEPVCYTVCTLLEVWEQAYSYIFQQFLDVINFYYSENFLEFCKFS